MRFTRAVNQRDEDLLGDTLQLADRFFDLRITPRIALLANDLEDL